MMTVCEVLHWCLHTSHVLRGAVNYLWEWVSVCKQVLQVAKWEGSVALVLTHYDPALCE